FNIEGVNKPISVTFFENATEEAVIEIIKIAMKALVEKAATKLAIPNPIIQGVDAIEDDLSLVESGGVVLYKAVYQTFLEDSIVDNVVGFITSNPDVDIRILVNGEHVGGAYYEEGLAVDEEFEAVVIDLIQFLPSNASKLLIPENFQDGASVTF